MAGSTFAWDKRHSSPPSFIVPKTLYRLPSKLQSPPPTWWQNPHMKLWRIETVGKIEINTLQSFGLFLHQKVLLCGKLGDNSWLSVSPVFQPGQTFATTPFCGKLSGQHSTSGSTRVSIDEKCVFLHHKIFVSQEVWKQIACFAKAVILLSSWNIV